MKFLLPLVGSLLFFSSNAYSEDPTRIHKNDYLKFCMEKRDSQAYCECTLEAVNTDIEKRKVRMETMIANEKAKSEKAYNFALKRLMKMKAVSSEDEISADCEVMRSFQAGEITEDEYGKIFSDKKSGYYKAKIEGELCASQGTNKSKNAELYESKDYEYVNASYIMTADNKCHRQFLQAK